MGRESNSITLSLESLRFLGSWAADCAERSLSVYETVCCLDSRPGAAIEGIRMFASGDRLHASVSDCPPNKAHSRPSGLCRTRIGT